MRPNRVTLAILISLLALTAAGVSTYLAWKTVTAGPVAGCGAAAGASCDDVLASRWSKWFGLPVSALAAAVYTGIAAIAWPVALRPGSAVRGVLTFLSVLAVGAALWFVGVQVLALGAFCPWCMTVHACSLLIAGLTLALVASGGEAADQQAAATLISAMAPGVPRTARPTNSSTGPTFAGPLVGGVVAVVCLAALASGQLLSKPVSPELAEISFEPAGEGGQTDQDKIGPDDEIGLDETSEDDGAEEDDGPRELEPIELDAGPTGDNLPPLAADERLLRFKGLSEPVGVDDLPLLGSPDAPHMAVEVVDYTCRHCRDLHPYVSAEIERRDGELAFFVHHLPLNRDCNPNMNPNLKPSRNNRYACEYAKLAITVWLRKPEAFQEYHDWLMEGEEPPRITRARVRATEILGSDELLLNNRLRNQVADRVSAQCEAFASLKRGLPIMLFEQNATHGVPRDEQVFTELLDSVFAP